MQFMALLLLVQAADVDQLKRGGWGAVEELGARPEAKAKLAELTRAADPEVRWWAGAALAELEAREEAGDGYVGSLRVSLEGKDKPLREVVQSLLSKAGLRLIHAPKSVAGVSVSWKDVPLLRAIEEVCRPARLGLARRTGSQFDLVPQDVPRVPVFYQGCFGVSIVSLATETEVSFNEDPKSHLELKLSLSADPRARMLGNDLELEFVSAVDDTGKSLLAAGQECAGPADSLGILGARLEAPAKEARRIAKIRGVITVTVARKTEDLVFEKVLSDAPRTKEAGGVKVVLEQCRREGDGYSVVLDLSLRNESCWIDYGELVLEDAAGKAFVSPIRGTSSGRNSGCNLGISFSDPGGRGEAECLRLSVVTETHRRRVYFELKDLVLR